MRIVFRVDGSPHIGLGHVMRCLTLASHLKPVDQVTFLSRPLPAALKQQIRQKGIVLLTPPQLCDEEKVDATPTVLNKTAQITHARQCIEMLLQSDNVRVDLLVIDHYQLSSFFGKEMRKCCDHIVVIDDLANRQHDCDVLLDQNLYKDFETRYERLVPSDCQMLLGPKYAILRDEFYSPSIKPRKKNHFLVCFGGSDPLNLTERIVDVLLSLKSQRISTDIVVGAGYVNIDSLRSKVALLANAELHVACTYIAELMTVATTMIGAGGSMHWERAASGLAGIIITLAENQIETTRCLHERQCCLWLGSGDEITDKDISNVIEFAIGSPQKVRQLANNAASLVSGNKNPSFVLDTILNIIKR